MRRGGLFGLPRGGEYTFGDDEVAEEGNGVYRVQVAFRRFGEVGVCLKRESAIILIFKSSAAEACK